MQQNFKRGKKVKNKIRATIIGLTLIGATLSAEILPYQYDENSLIGVEGGYSTLDYNKASQSIQSVKLLNAGLKIGAESKNFRVFLSGRYFQDSTAEFKQLTTFGGELQYKFISLETFNLFVGANGGYANVRFDTGDGFGTRSTSTSYFGADIGANIHLGQNMDLELGSRIISLQATHVSNTFGNYYIDKIMNIYVSLIFKWTAK